MRVVVVGSANIDLVATAPHLPRAGETVLGNDFSQVPGGKGANQAIAACRAGASVALIGAIGSDSFGVTLRARLTASTVDISLLRVVYGTSGVALIVVDPTGENMIVVAPGANAALTSLTEADLAAIRGADVLLLQLEIPLATVTAAAVAAREAGVRVLLNAAPARTLPAELEAAVDLLVVNQVEGAALAGVSRWAWTRYRTRPRRIRGYSWRRCWTGFPGWCSRGERPEPGTAAGTPIRYTYRRRWSRRWTAPRRGTRSPPRSRWPGAKGGGCSMRSAGPAPPVRWRPSGRAPPTRFRSAGTSTRCTPRRTTVDLARPAMMGPCGFC